MGRNDINNYPLSLLTSAFCSTFGTLILFVIVYYLGWILGGFFHDREAARIFSLYYLFMLGLFSMKGIFFNAILLVMIYVGTVTQVPRLKVALLLTVFFGTMLLSYHGEDFKPLFPFGF